MLEFVIQIGSTNNKYRCTQPNSPNEGIIVDYSTDNEITWHPLKLIEPIMYNGTKEWVVLELPAGAKTERTVFRWWQPLGYGGLLLSFFLTLSILMTTQEAFVDSIGQDQTAQNMQSNLLSAQSTFFIRDYNKTVASSYNGSILLANVKA